VPTPISTENISVYFPSFKILSVAEEATVAQQQRRLKTSITTALAEKNLSACLHEFFGKGTI